MTATSDRTKHFDAPRPASAFGAAVRLLAARWPIGVAMVVATAIVGGLAFGLLGVARLTTVGFDASVAATPLFVLIDPRATAGEAESLGPQLRALPGVGEATLRPRDDALRALVASGLPPPDGRNPLPDVWTVYLKPSGNADFAATLATLQTTVAALPRVDATRVDERWVARLDGWMATAAEMRPIALVVGAIVLGALLTSLALIGGRALGASRRSVLAIAVMLIGTTSLVVDGALGWMMERQWKPAADGLVERTAARIEASDGALMVVGFVVILLILVAGALVSRSANDSRDASI